ncbi:MAG: PGF-pre-PGF domain-containing protein [Candidatus Woesearchaeota archaeon]
MKRGESKFYSKLVIICLAVFVLAYFTISSPISTFTADIPANNSWSNTSTMTFNCTFLTVEDDPHTTPLNMSLYLRYSDVSAFVWNQTNSSAGLINNTAYNFTVIGLPDGKLEWFCELFNGTTDAALDRNVTFNYTLWVDTNKPSLVNLSRPVHMFNTTQSTIDFNFSGVDNVATTLNCTLGLDGVGMNKSSLGANNTLLNVQVTGIPNGVHYWNASCRDNASNLNSSIQTFTFTVDSLKPHTMNISWPTEDYNSSSADVNVNWTATDNVAAALYCNVTLDGAVNNTAYKISVNGTMDNYTIIGMSNGRHELNVTCYDGLFNFNTTGLINITVDTLKPSSILIDSPVEKANKSSTFNVNWTVKDNVATTLYCNVTIDGAVNNTAYVLATNGTTANYTIRSLSQAYHHELNVTCYDGLFNFNTTGLLNFTVDSVVPNVALSYPAADEAYDVTALDFNFTATDNNMTDLTCSLTLDSVVNVSGVPAINAALKNITVTGIPSGTHSWNVTCVDNASNSNISVTRSFSISLPVAAAATAASSGGGGSSSSAPAAWESYTFNVLDSDKPTTYKLMDKGIGISDITFAVISKATNVKLRVEKLSSMPSEVTGNPDGEVYRYLKIEKTNLDNSNIAWAKIGFVVDKSWLDANGLKTSDVVLSKYLDDKWQALPTKLVSSAADKYQFEATSEGGFSVFVITAKAGAAEVVTEEVAEEKESAEQPVAPSEEIYVPATAEKASRAWLWFILAVGAIVLVVVVVVYARRNQATNKKIRKR